MVMFNSYVTVYQRVTMKLLQEIEIILGSVVPLLSGLIYIYIYMIYAYITVRTDVVIRLVSQLMWLYNHT